MPGIGARRVERLGALAMSGHCGQVWVGQRTQSSARVGRSIQLRLYFFVAWALAVVLCPAPDVLSQVANGGESATGWQTKSTGPSPSSGAGNSRTNENSAPKAGPKPAAVPTAKNAVAPQINSQSGRAIEATGAKLSTDGNVTTFSIDFTRSLKAEIVTLANPYRVIVDMANVTFRLPAGTGREPLGLVTAFRYGLFAEGKARIVLDATGPVVISRAELKPVPGGSTMRLAIDLVATDAASFGEGTGAARAAAAAAIAQEALTKEQKPAIHEDRTPAPKQRAKPVIMIDPGHGGIDPGAVSTANLYEKTVVLAVAKQLQSALVAKGRYDVLMTRQSDVFVSLDQRLKLSRQTAPDLFISLHADSIDTKGLTQAIRGASVYTLSERASDELARLAAEKENASDLIAGLQTAEGEGQDQVRSILIDLLKRETANFSADFSRMLVSKLGKSVPLARDHSRAAAFKVLKQPGSPSVLVELGYLSNPDDEKLMTSPDWQKQVTAAIALAVDAYFGRRAVGSR